MAVFSGGCNSPSASTGGVNPNFPDIGESAVSPSASVDPNDQGQVILVEPGEDYPSGAIGYIADQDPTWILCVIVDPAADGNTDLEVCDADQANTETTSINAVCPESEAASRCSSSGGGSEPDFCEVTGARDYLFVVRNPTSDPVRAAYQVVNVTEYPNPSCADLDITEETILADDAD